MGGRGGGGGEGGSRAKPGNQLVVYKKTITTITSYKEQEHFTHIFIKFQLLKTILLKCDKMDNDSLIIIGD